jgi:hypothetical protein
VYSVVRKQRQEEYTMRLLHWILKRVGAAGRGNNQPEALRMAGLDENTLRRMDPDARVAALEQANLDPYDYIYLAC